MIKCHLPKIYESSSVERKLMKTTSGGNWHKQTIHNKIRSDLFATCLLGALKANFVCYIILLNIHDQLLDTYCYAIQQDEWFSSQTTLVRLVMLLIFLFDTWGIKGIKKWYLWEWTLQLDSGTHMVNHDEGRAPAWPHCPGQPCDFG